MTEDRRQTIEYIVEQLIQKSFVVVDHVLPDQVVQNLHAEIIAADEENQLHHAKISQQGIQENSIRSDLIAWIDESNPSPALKIYLDFLEQLRLQINQEFQLGLFEHEMHYTLYRAGSFYKKHVDQFKTNKSRQLSFILYLNADWQRQEGGELMLFDEYDRVITKILPHANQFVCFFSDIPHEVCITHRERLSVTGWFKSR